METRLSITTKASIMESIFDNSEALSIRYYEAKDLNSDEDFDPDKTYTFDVVVRHPENTKASILLNKEIKKLSNNKNL